MTNLEKMRLLLAEKTFEKQKLLIETSNGLFFNYMDLFGDAVERFKELGCLHRALLDIKNPTLEQEEEIALIAIMQLSIYRIIEPLVETAVNNHESFKEMLKDGKIIAEGCRLLKHNYNCSRDENI